MRRTHPYPLPCYALDEFIHPAAGHVLGCARRHEGEVLAGNGYVAIRCTRGRWLAEDWPEAGAGFLERFESLAWDSVPAGPWRALADVAMWFPRDGAGLPWSGCGLAQSPAWRVGEAVVRVALLALVARLPRSEVVAGTDREDALHFRFSGGCGMIAHDPRLAAVAVERWVLQSDADCLTGERVERSTTPKPSFSLPGWPPPEPEYDF